MNRKGFTTDKCPGCGETEERKKDSVCPKCMERLETAKRLEERYEELKKEPFMVECMVPTGWDVPRFFTSRCGNRDESLNDLGKLLQKLSQLCAVPSGYKLNYGYMQHLMNSPYFSLDEQGWNNDKLPVVFKTDEDREKNWKFEGKALMPKEIFETLTALVKSIETSLKTTEDQSIEFGKNALLMLNSGKISMLEFSEM